MLGNGEALRRHPLQLAGAALAVTIAATACSTSGGGSATTGAAAAPAATGSGKSASAVAKTTVRIEAHRGPLGTYLTDGSGKSLYMFASDTASTSTCTGACATYWPPLTAASNPAVAGAVKSSDLSTIIRSDGTKQVTYAGHPLYYYAGDAKPGDTNGQGSSAFGAKWWLLAPSGKPVTATSPTGKGASSGANGSSTSGSYGSGGGGGYG